MYYVYIVYAVLLFVDFFLIVCYYIYVTHSKHSKRNTLERIVMGEEKKSVKSFRLSEATQEELKEIAGNQPIDDVFQLMIAAYKEKQIVRTSIDSARINQLDSLCTQLKNLFSGVIDERTMEIEKARIQNMDELEKLRHSIEGKNRELSNAQAVIQELNEKLAALQSEREYLKKLNDSLGNENAALKQNIELLQNKLPKAPAAKKTTTKKKEAPAPAEPPAELDKS